MSFEILSIPHFDRAFKKLAKKYPSLKLDIKRLVEGLKINPKEGKTLGNNCYKVRMAIGSKGKGKSGGARIITHLKIIDQKVFLLSIYDKSEVETIAEKELKGLLEQIPD